MFLRILLLLLLSVSAAYAQTPTWMQVLGSGGTNGDSGCCAGAEVRSLMPAATKVISEVRVTYNANNVTLPTTFVHVSACIQAPASGVPHGGPNCAAPPVEQTCSASPYDHATNTGLILAKNAPNLVCDPILLRVLVGQSVLVIFDMPASGNYSAVGNNMAAPTWQSVATTWNQAQMGGTINDTEPQAIALAEYLPEDLETGELTAASSINLEAAGLVSTPLPPGQSGKIKLIFSDASGVPFLGGNSTTELFIDPEVWTTDHVISAPIQSASSIGAAIDQGVQYQLVVASSHKPLSRLFPAKFRNDPVIARQSGVVTPTADFLLEGWDLGLEGMLNIHFPTAFEPNSSVPSPRDVSVPVPANRWSRWAVRATMPTITGVPGQIVEITLTTLDGRRSNTWPATFVPTMEHKQLTWQDINVVTCSNQGVTNACNNVVIAFPQSDLCPSQSAILGNDSFDSLHYGCWGGDPDQGMDTYSAYLNYGWQVDSFAFNPTYTDNGEVLVNPVSTPGVAGYSKTIYWYVGEEGGLVGYAGVIGVKGPVGVPYH